MKYTFFSVFLYSFISIAQPSTAKKMGLATDEEKKISRVLNEEISPRVDEFNRIVRKLKSSSFYSAFYNRAGIESSDSGYRSYIDDNKELLRQLDANGLFKKCDRINELRKSIDAYKVGNDACRWLDYASEKANDNIQWAEEKSEEYRKSKDLEKSKDAAHKLRMEELNRELESELSQVNRSEEDSEMNDDFLAIVKKKTNQDVNESLQKEKIDFKIIEKDGMQGVEDLNGNILIPYKEWIVERFSDGVAKVQMEIDRIPFDNNYNYRIKTNEFVVYKTGYVDSSGGFLTDPIITVSGGCYYDQNFLFARRSGQSSEDWRRYQKEFKLNSKIELQKCEKESQERIKVIKSRYQ